MKALSVTGLEVGYGHRTAVSGVEFSVGAGECFGLLGPNGAGKSSTLGAILGLQRARRGRVRIFGTRASDARARERFGAVLQDTELAPRLTIRETLRLFRSQYRRGRDIGVLIESLGLARVADQEVRSLSGGEHRLLAFAVALVGDPELVILDEPTAALDPVSRRRIWDAVAGLRERGAAVLLSTHYLEEAEALCDRVAILDRGRLILVDEPAAIVARGRGGQRVDVELSGPMRADAIAALGRVAVRGNTLSIDLAELATVLPRAIAAADELGLRIVGIESKPPSLESVFLRLVGGEA